MGISSTLFYDYCGANRGPSHPPAGRDLLLYKIVFFLYFFSSISCIIFDIGTLCVFLFWLVCPLWVWDGFMGACVRTHTGEHEPVYVCVCHVCVCACARVRKMVRSSSSRTNSQYNCRLAGLFALKAAHAAHAAHATAHATAHWWHAAAWPCSWVCWDVSNHTVERVQQRGHA